MVEQNGMETLSQLVIAKAALRHTGVYKCAPSNADAAAITVHIFKGKLTTGSELSQ